jgi:hypothetical protein
MDGVNGGEDVGQPGRIVAAHWAAASARTSSRRNAFSESGVPDVDVDTDFVFEVAAHLDGVEGGRVDGEVDVAVGGVVASGHGQSKTRTLEAWRREATARSISTRRRPWS